MCSCGLTKDDDKVQKARIADIVQRIQDAFNRNEVDKIMSYYRNDFMHNGFNEDSVRYWWIQKRAENKMIDKINIINIEINETYARADIIIDFINFDDIRIPYPGDRMAYFYHERGYWRIYGNQRTSGEVNYEL